MLPSGDFDASGRLGGRFQATRRRWRSQGLMLAATAVVGVPLLAGIVSAETTPPRWSGSGAYRVLIELPADSAGGTQTEDSDEQIASCPVNFDAWLTSQGIAGEVDLATIEIHRYDPQTGKPSDAVAFPSSSSPYGWPCRFEDDRLPDDYPSRVGRASETETGRPTQVTRRRKGRLFNRIMDPSQGRIIWTHRQRGQTSAHYALYFDVVAEGTAGISPAPWIGDADVLRRQRGSSLGGFSHFMAATGDLNGDGLDDLVAGTEKGDLMWFPNRGTRDQALFVGCHVLQDEAGPMDVGWYAAPFLYDWNDDGLLDLLAGTSGNALLWWQNKGNRQAPSFEFRGFVMCGDKRLEVPQAPVAEDPVGIFKRDYFNQPWVGDFDGDGLPDIVTGGYTTGQIFYFRALGRDEEGVPRLAEPRRLATAEGPIDTVWAAAPLVVDVDSDGHLDILTGGWWWSGIPTPPGPGDADLLRFYRGQSGGDLLFRREPFPRRGEFPPGQIARPSLLHFNADELPDLLVSQTGGAVYVAPNVGRAGQPLWEMPKKPLTIAWGFARDWNASATGADVDGDGVSELLVGNVVWTVGGEIRSPKKVPLGVCRVDGQPIDHPGPGYGDPYSYSVLFDWNNDGRMDILWGTHQGNVYVHLQDGSDDLLAFEPGTLVELAAGAPVSVGPPIVENAEEAADFTVLQGSRIVFAVEDLDDDGADDLIVGDTFANLWCFRGVDEGRTRKFRPRVLLAKLRTRPEAICVADWNRDGKSDILLGGTAAEPGVIYANASEPGTPALAPPAPLAGLPYLFWGPQIRVTDWNHDGDVDLMVQSEFFSFWIERSFLEHGYRQAQPVPSGMGQPDVDQQYIQAQPRP